MEGTTTITEARSLFANNFIGQQELTSIFNKIEIHACISEPYIPYSIDQLQYYCNTHLLILGISSDKNGKSITIKYLREHFGIDPQISEPCFYNQDWYLKEKFINICLKNEWYLISKNLISNTRGKIPVFKFQKPILPPAILCTYAFFINWFHQSQHLWCSDYVWCNDIDSHGDQIFVGRYFDKDKRNKNGFSIHRYLSIKNNYGCIDLK